MQFATRGWHVFLSLDVRLKPDTTENTIIAVTTDSRALPNDAAKQLTFDALRMLMGAGAERVFLKIDSTMRGSVCGQVAGALDAWRMQHPDARAIVCPAYPRMGRTVEAGRLLVHGEPVERTPIGRDPVSPVTTSELAALMPPSERIGIVDAATDDDLMKIAESIATASVIPVGSGGLAAAIAKVWTVGRVVGRVRVEPDRDLIPRRKNSRILLQISSLNPVSHAQVARLKARFPDVVVLLPPTERGDSAVVAEILAREFATQVAREEWDILGLVGGDGARATLKSLGASGIRILDALIEGVPLGIVAGGTADGTPVFTKAGGFGDADALVECVERMRGARGPREKA